MDVNNFQPDVSPKERVKAAKRIFSRLGFRLLFGLLVTYVIAYGVQYLFAFIKPEVYQNYNYTILLALIPQYFLGMPAIILFLFRLPAKAPEKRKVTFGWCVIFFIIAYSLMIAANFVGSMLDTILSYLIGKEGTSTYAAEQMITNANVWLVFVVMVIIAPIYEEFIFRKVLIDRCGPYGQVCGALLSGWAFGLFHGNLTQAIYAFVIGFFLGIIYQKTGKIQVTIGLHMVINFMGSMVSIGLMKLVDVSKLSGLNSIEAIMEFAQENLLGLIVYMLYATLVYGLFIAGIVLTIVHRKKLLPSKGIMQLPKHNTFNAVILNPGVLVLTAVMLVIVAINLVFG